MQLRLKGTAHNLAIKGLFKYIDPNSAEAAALIAEGYEKVNWGVDLVKYKDHYTDTNLLPGVKAGNVAPRFYWPMPFETLTMSKGKIKKEAYSRYTKYVLQEKNQIIYIVIR